MVSSRLSDEIRKMISGPVKISEPLCRHTTLRVGGPARIFCLPASSLEMRALLNWSADRGISTRVLGGGSNLLVSDAGVDDLVICTTSASDGISTVHNSDSAVDWLVGAGSRLSEVVDQATRRGLSGLQKLAGIPGTVGGAIVMNAGAAGSTIADSVIRVDAWDPEPQSVMEFDADSCRFGYRDSVFQSNTDQVVLQTRLRLSKDDSERLCRMKERQVAVRRRKQPLGWPSAGCIFRNPSEGAAGYFIEQAGYKGRRLGGAMVSRVHANFIVNCGSAAAEDVLGLIDEIREAVLQQFGIELELEIKTWGVTDG